MKKKKLRCYIYVRVSTFMQVDEDSLEMCLRESELQAKL